MTLKTWIPTFLAFPAGGLLAIELVGSVDGPATAAAGGLLAGAVLGAGQWLALRSRGIGARWIVHTAVALSAGSALAAVLTDAGTGVELMLSGLIAGAAVGAAQSPLLARASWIAVTAASWALGWLATASIGVDVERGYVLFGAAGAILVTLLTGLALVRPAAVR